jgi:hypothetical protein
MVTGPSGIPARREDVGQLFVVVYLCMAFAPFTTALILTGVVDGKEGYRRLFGRLFRWRADLRWYGVALLTTPLLLLAVLLPLTAVSRAFTLGILAEPDKLAVLATGIVGGIGAGLLEEVGWTGFALVKMRQWQRSALTVALTLGAIHGVWHFLGDFWGGAAFYGAAYYIPHIVSWVLALTALRVLIVWVYQHTQSLLLAVLMHASFTGSQRILEPTQVSAPESVVWYAAFMIGLWAMVAIVVRLEGPELNRSMTGMYSHETRGGPRSSTRE